jgi:hypothetical protein
VLGAVTAVVSQVDRIVGTSPATGGLSLSLPRGPKLCPWKRGSGPPQPNTLSVCLSPIPFFASPLPTEGPGYGYSMRSSRRIGNLWAALGKNSRSKSPPASVAIEIKKVLVTIAAVMLGSG